MREVSVKAGAGKLLQTISVGGHVVIADEPERAGGDDRGPTPHELLLGALGACTSITVKTYAARRGWALEGVEVRVVAHRDETKGLVADCRVALEGELDEAQRARLLEIARRCPVRRTLTEAMRIETALAD